MKSKIFFTGALALLICMSFAIAGGPTGFGLTLSATTSTQTETLPRVASVSVFNSDSTETVHYLINISIADFDVRFAAGTTIVVPPETPVTLRMPEGDNRGIESITYRTGSGTATAFLASM